MVEAPYQMHVRLAATRLAVERHFSIQEEPVALAPECATKMAVNSIYYFIKKRSNPPPHSRNLHCLPQKAKINVFEVFSHGAALKA